MPVLPYEHDPSVFTAQPVRDLQGPGVRLSMGVGRASAGGCGVPVGCTVLHCGGDFTLRGTCFCEAPISAALAALVLGQGMHL